MERVFIFEHKTDPRTFTNEVVRAIDLSEALKLLAVQVSNTNDWILTGAQG